MFVAFLLVGALLIAGVVGAIKATIVLQSTIVETPATSSVPFGASGSTKITSDGLNKSTTYEATGAAGLNGTEVGYGTVAMVGGVGSINLAACPGLGGVAQDFTGKYIRSIHVRAKSTNANAITIAKGVTNGYTGAGSAFSVTLKAGKEALIECDGSVAVAAGVRTLDISGTGTQELEFIITVGTN